MEIAIVILAIFWSIDVILTSNRIDKLKNRIKKLEDGINTNINRRTVK